MNKKDLDFINEDFRFLVRVSAIITDYNCSKIILFKAYEEAPYLLPGGRVIEMEDSLTAIKREIKEELNIDGDYTLVAINENILKNKKIQNIDFVYHIKIDNIYDVKAIEDKNQIFEVVDILNVRKYDIKPSSVIEIIKNLKKDNKKHFINKE